MWSLRTWFYYFSNIELPAVIILVLFKFHIVLFIVPSRNIIFGWFKLWCVVHYYSYLTSSLLEFYELLKSLEN
jgi:hypothetical protein